MLHAKHLPKQRMRQDILPLLREDLGNPVVLALPVHPKDKRLLQRSIFLMINQIT